MFFTSSNMANNLSSSSGENWNEDGREIICRTNLEQIKEAYLETYGEELVDFSQKIDLSNQRNEICTLLSLWMLAQHERDAVTARNAIEHGDTNYKALIEIYCGRKSSHLLLIKQAYQTKFKRKLDQDIINVEPPSPYQRILIALATSHKSHHADVSQHIAKCDARRLYETGEGTRGAIEESVVLEIFSKRSIPQLRTTFSTYKHIYGHGYTKSLKKESNGEFGDALRIAVKCLYTPSKYYAKILYGSIIGTTMDKSALARVMMSRVNSIDMDDIKRIFKKKYGMELKDVISETIPSEECRNFLVTLANICFP